MKISILEFSVENFKIFKEKATFEMFARKSKHTFPQGGQNILKTALIYGPNASGKSSLLDALSVLRNEVLYSANNPDTLPYAPFILGEQEHKPIAFEVVFILNAKIFQYDFSFQADQIITENLFEISASGKENKYFKRAGQNIKVALDFKTSKDVADLKTRQEVLFLSAAAQWNNELAMQIVAGFKNINVISGPDSDRYTGYTMNLFDRDSAKKAKILNFLQKADFCIEDRLVRKIEIPKTIKKLLIDSNEEAPNKANMIFFSHPKFDSQNNRIGTVDFNLGRESAGTQKFFDLLGPIVDTLEGGKVLFVDEFDNSIHPLLTKLIIDLFENPKVNPKNAQLVVTTHDTSLLSDKDLHKEQVWFTEKDKFGAAKIFSLAEFEIRNDVEFSKKYLEGRFGALPFLDFEDETL